MRDNEIQKVFDGKGGNGFLVWKQLGETPLETLNRVRQELGLDDKIKMTYAGRLDPAAEGELLVLTGEACKRKPEFLGLDKAYQFQVLLGIETDTLDLLGLLTQVGEVSDQSKIDFATSVTTIKKGLISKHAWPYPAYSSKKYNGKQMWQWAREGEYQRLLDQHLVPENNFEIYSVEFLKKQMVFGREVLEKVNQISQRVAGDFRQAEIMSSWQDSVQENKSYVLLEFRAKVSTGTYIRQICQQIGQSLSVPAIAFSITRIKIHL